MEHTLCRKSSHSCRWIKAISVAVEPRAAEVDSTSTSLCRVPYGIFTHLVSISIVLILILILIILILILILILIVIVIIVMVIIVMVMEKETGLVE